MTSFPIPAQSALAAYKSAATNADRTPADEKPSSVTEFGDLLAQSIDNAVEAGRSGEQISIQAASGRADLQDVVEAVNAAEISLQTVVSIRDRVISAYQEIMRMPI